MSVHLLPVNAGYQQFELLRRQRPCGIIYTQPVIMQTQGAQPYSAFVQAQHFDTRPDFIGKALSCYEDFRLSCIYCIKGVDSTAHVHRFHSQLHYETQGVHDRRLGAKSYLSGNQRGFEKIEYADPELAVDDELFYYQVR